MSGRDSIQASLAGRCRRRACCDLDGFRAGRGWGRCRVAPQYDSTHVYVAPPDVDRFVASFLATFCGTGTGQVVTTVTPTPSSTNSQLVSLFGFRSPIPYPFGAERTGYLMVDLDAAVAAARAAGAAILVKPYSSGGRTAAMVQFPGGYVAEIHTP